MGIVAARHAPAVLYSASRHAGREAIEGREREGRGKGGGDRAHQGKGVLQGNGEGGRAQEHG